MFKSFSTVPHTDSITTFLNSLTYWQSRNLYITLLQARSDISFNDAKEEAIVNSNNPKNLKYMLEESLNSPFPKIKNNNSFEEFLKKTDEILKERSKQN